MKRTEFLKTVAGVVAASSLPTIGSAYTQVPLSAPWPVVDPTDEYFWKFVRTQFPLTQDRAYFNTGGLGASPYVVIDVGTLTLQLP